MAFVAVARADDVPPEGMIRVVYHGGALLLARVGPNYHALPDHCPHQGGSLAEGRLETDPDHGATVKCPKHGSRFQLATGKCLEPPKILVLSLPKKDTVSYPVEVRGDELFVDLP